MRAEQLVNKRWNRIPFRENDSDVGSLKMIKLNIVSLSLDRHRANKLEFLVFICCCILLFFLSLVLFYLQRMSWITSNFIFRLSFIHALKTNVYWRNWFSIISSHFHYHQHWSLFFDCFFLTDFNIWSFSSINWYFTFFKNILFV